MKRQVAVTGPTPEFVRWAVRYSCPLRRDLEVGSIDATEKRLRAIRVAGLALGQKQVYDGIAAKLIGDRPKAFRIEEVFRVFGGVEQVAEHCRNCAANILAIPQRHGSLAGCHGWLSRTGRASLSDLDQSEARAIDLGSMVESEADEKLRQHANDLFLPTREIWYGLWAARLLSGDQLRFVEQIFDRLIQGNELAQDVKEFHQVLKACSKNKLQLDVELIPAGFSNGLRWTIGAHCDRCRARFDPGQNGCRCCQKSGKGHPEIHRKVRGLRPWVDLEGVIGPEQVSSFLRLNELQQE